MTDQRARARVHATGRVQGVFFRATTRDRARKAGVDGWVTNLADGRVEAVFEGPAEDVETMIEFCQTGSDAAHVDEVEVEYEEPQAIEGFEIRR